MNTFEKVRTIQWSRGKKLLWRNKTPLQCILASVLLFALAASIFMHPASALAQGYATDDQDLRPGMVAALSETSTSENPKVERAAQDNMDKVIGVTTTPGSDLVTVVSGPDQVYVQTTGEVDAFVSDINGEVKTGDLLTISPLRGVLMKADNSTATVVGIALENMTDQESEVVTVDETGGQRDVQVVTLRINLDHKAASNQQANTTDSSLSRVGEAVTGRDVTEVRVLAGMVIFLIVLVAEGGIIYGAVSSAITAMGRNPMARKIILKEVVRVVLIALMVLGLGVLAIYAVLWV
jgi:hypothetical protein